MLPGPGIAGLAIRAPEGSAAAQGSCRASWGPYGLPEERTWDHEGPWSCGGQAAREVAQGEPRALRLCTAERR
eukprot:14981086-Alexandrium_andersonii.AAC.1